MTLFSLLLVLVWERLFKLGEHWQIDHRFEPLFCRSGKASLMKTILMAVVWMAVIYVILKLAGGLFFGVISLLLWIVIALFCIGAGEIRRHYRDYLTAARKGEADAASRMADELALIHGLPQECSEEERLRELQNALVWINFRFYLAPLFWFVAAGPFGPVALAGYALLRAYQTWLARRATPLERAMSGVDRLLHWLDWIPARLAGVAYALLGHGEKALPAWLASLTDGRTSQYSVLTHLAQFSLAREPHTDAVKTPRAAVTLARKITMVLVVIVALLTIYGALM
ncbi:beta-lactamase regulator AmpE [Enterobacillus tribolii]|uniref:AmpE protein n=1 Tax=Enterobacillus tribolii TaxID=1487935 RepID=A0A370R1S8_9GAMM|nr:beta-lactamase regulator AmpE [Enterobacillus tribolii]MBW7983027.1 beta-lactamase regulator AmpE [Enterobacillus tribolii]RDK95869.1 AmpE protein [Enterobacillus tribolii]